MDATILNTLWQKTWAHLESTNVKGTKLPGMAAEKVITHIDCPFCGKRDWTSFPDNTPGYDVQCNACLRYYQVKAKENLKPSRVRKELRVMGTTYQTAHDVIGYVCYIMFSYASNSKIRNIYIVDASDVSDENIIRWNTKPMCTIIFKKGTYRKLRFLRK
jgi:hypothetical protein